MRLSSRWGLLTLLAAVITGYLVGSARTETPCRSPLILDQAQIVSVHPAGLYVRTRAGVQRHFLIDPLDREWASALARYPGSRWHLELEPSSCPERYSLSAGTTQDLTQDFFVRILEGRHLHRADPNRGRFRSFLLNSCKFFLADQADRARAQKRSAGTILPFEVTSGEQQYRFEPLDNKTPEHIFERSWAIVLIDRVVSCLRDEFVQHGSLRDFEKLKVFLLGQAEIPYSELAREMGEREGRLKVLIHRLRKRYRILFQNAIAETVADPAEVDSEIRFLMAALRRKN